MNKNFSPINNEHSFIISDEGLPYLKLNYESSIMEGATKGIFERDPKNNSTILPQALSINSYENIQIQPKITKLGFKLQNKKNGPLKKNLDSSKSLFFKSEKKFQKNWKFHTFKTLVFSPFATDEIFYNHLMRTYHQLKLAKVLVKFSSFFEINENKFIKLNYSKNSKILFFELEGILISNSNRSDIHDFILDDNYETNLFKIRPFCIESLKILTHYYEIFIFTEMHRSKADKIMRFLDPDGKIFRGLLSQSNCFKTKKNFYVKDLRTIMNKDISEMIIIDQTPYSFAFQINNGIPIRRWYDDYNDCELKYLTHYLVELNSFADVREGNKRYLRLEDLASKNFEEISI